MKQIILANLMQKLVAEYETGRDEHVIDYLWARVNALRSAPCNH